MRNVLLAAVSCLVIAGCDSGPSDAEKFIDRVKQEIATVEGNIEDQEGDLSDVKTGLTQARGQCTTAKSDRSKRINELKASITDSLDQVERANTRNNSFDGDSWTVAVESLSDSSWSWLEKEYRYNVDERDDEEARVDEIRYSVNPQKLSSQVEVGEYNGFPAVVLKCEGGANCITGKGSSKEGTRSSSTGNRDTQSREINKQIKRNYWPVSSATVSGKVAQTASDLIALYRDGTPEACEKVEELETEKSSLESEIASLENKLASLKSDLRTAEALED